MYLLVVKRGKVRDFYRIFEELERRKELEIAAVCRGQTYSKKWKNDNGREKLVNFTQGYTRVSQHG
jgi:hypothetical protein